MISKNGIFLILLSLSMVIGGCKSQKANNGEIVISEPVMIFGSSGGFAGRTLRYKLHQDGSVYKGGAGEAFTLVNSLDENLTIQMFSNFSNLGFDRIELNDPGNMTYFIIAEQGEKQKKLAWGGMNKEMPDNLEIYYKSFMKLMKKQSNNVVDME